MDPPGAEHGKLTGKPVNDQIAGGRSHWNPVASDIFQGHIPG